MKRYRILHCAVIVCITKSIVQHELGAPLKSTLFLRFMILHGVLLACLRIAFYVAFKPLEEFSSSLIWKSFVLGSRFDLRLICVLLIPLILFSWRSWSTDSVLARRRWTLFYGFLACFWLLFYVFDFGFYGYLNSRMNSSALLFLENPDISFGMLWQSYPVVWVALGFSAFIVFYMILLQRFVFRQHKKSFFNLPSFLVTLIFLFSFVTGLYGQISQYPLRWSEAFFSPHHFVSHLALNPVLYFFESYEFSSKKEYDVKKVQEFYDEFADYLGVIEKDKENLNFSREVRSIPRTVRPNVIVIVMESLAFSKTNLGENPLKPTPELEKIANKSYWFSNYFSPTEGTARNLFSIMTATPDVTKVQTSTRNPLVVDQKVIANSYDQYRRMYFVGGSASWANIRGIFSHNIDGIEIYEEDAFQRSRADVWGVSDLDLFIEAHERFAKLPQDQPFFAVIQTASFHRPYTIPQKAGDFKLRDEPVTKLKEAGFYSGEQFNSLRFSDYSLGVFFEMAKKSAYYKNTLFVITGDHGLPDEGGVNVPQGSHLWELEKYHVPLVLHHSDYFQRPEQDSKLASHVDVMTTVAALAGVSHTNTTLGRNLFDPYFDKERYAFIYNYYSELNEYGLIGENFYLHYDDKHGAQLFAYREESPLVDQKEQHPAEFIRMQRLAEAYLQTSKYLLFNNQKKSQKKGAGRNQPQK
jgi:phosphoglycerol transferase MdoB-like AlkP superfamily enzyme